MRTAFRVVSIENPSELHVSNGQLLVEQENRSVTIPVNDMVMLVVGGAAIRMSTMTQALLADNNAIILHLGKNHHPSALTIPMVANARQTKVAYDQVGASKELNDLLWQRIIRRKIENQARALSILGLSGAEKCGRSLKLSNPEIPDTAKQLLPGNTSRIFIPASTGVPTIRSTAA